ncbi:TerC family protein [Elizabethkingia anophelis]|uniref:DUF475 domain-containing protein n=1 Tax=Elizabethkingia anophelis TaxID=1117645 RepID=A0AAU8VDA1_9FLAO|nr:DUF475 domain-containing protein [Elizabethkingia anophelis]AQX02193.1 hypothetical protein BBD32_12305 [Elizabethkingia anophelis]OPB60944.1 hypothetical protein BAY11_17720 [Elizabethkingia anophelis]
MLDNFLFYLNDMVHNPMHTLTVIFNLIIIESLLSIDNAAVLATMVMGLTQKKRDKALKYGILGAYIFRGLALVFASLLLSIWWLKPLGGAYLLFLCISWFLKKKDSHTITNESSELGSQETWIYKKVKSLIGPFWSTVLMVELMDLAFSIDNVFAAVAFSENILLISIGVFIGILAMRFVAQWFVILMKNYPFLENISYIVIGLLGLKLTLSLYEYYFPDSQLTIVLSSHSMEAAISVITILLFVTPILFSKFIKRK